MRKMFVTVAACLFVIGIAATANAVPMAGWTGSVALTVPGTWTGTIYYDVYAPGQADAPGIGSSIYYSYFYRVASITTTDAVVSLKHLTVGNPDHASIINVNTTDYSTAGLPPLVMGKTSDVIGWDWIIGYNEVEASVLHGGDYSDWCYFTSPVGPRWVSGSLQNGGGAIFGNVPGATPVPEPASMALLGMGLVGLAGAARRKFMA